MFFMRTSKFKTAQGHALPEVKVERSNVGTSKTRDITHVWPNCTILNKSIRRLVRGATGVRELKIST